ncbi:hypothetical protein PTKIN_Ptkin16aG0054800 [Pterospermum kingtungense]
MSSLVNQLSSSAMSEEGEAFVYAWCLRSSTLFPYVLDAAIQLGLFDILAKAGPDAPLSSYQIASQLHANNRDAPSLVERLYGLALPGKAFVLDENGGTLASFSMNNAKMEVWQHLKDFVLEGGNLFEKVHGMPIYQYMSLNTERARKFDTSMTNLSKIIVKKVLDS